MSDGVLKLITFLISPEHDLKMSHSYNQPGYKGKYYYSLTKFSVAAGFVANG